MTERHHYRDIAGIQREVWKQSDGDGSGETGLVGRKEVHAPKSWRFFQSSIGLLSESNPPPKYVILDDRAFSEIDTSGLYNDHQKFKYWGYDFSQQHGAVRKRRPHRGRPAYISEAEEADGSFEAAPREAAVRHLVEGKRGGKPYFLTGEPGGYTPVPPTTPHLDHESPTANTITPSSVEECSPRKGIEAWQSSREQAKGGVTALRLGQLLSGGHKRGEDNGKDYGSTKRQKMSSPLVHGTNTPTATRSRDGSPKRSPNPVGDTATESMSPSAGIEALLKENAQLQQKVISLEQQVREQALKLRTLQSAAPNGKR